MSMDQIDQAFFKKLLHEACDSKNFDKPKNVGTAMAMVYGAKKIKSRYSKIQKFLGIMNCDTMALELQFMFYYNLYEYLIKDLPSTDISYWKQLLTEHRYKDPDQSNDLWTNIFGDNVVNIKRIYMSDDGKIMKQEEKSGGEDGFDPDFFETFFSEDEDEESKDINTDSNGKKDITLGKEKEKKANNLGRSTDDTLHERDKIRSEEIRSEADVTGSKKDLTTSRKKKVWKEDGKWSHDKFIDYEQSPKTREELITIYGYDIRNEEGPPRARRRRLSGEDCKVEYPLNIVQHKSKSQDNSPASAQGPHLAYKGIETSRVGDRNFSETIETNLSEQKNVTIGKSRMMKMSLEELEKQEQCLSKVPYYTRKDLYDCLLCNIRLEGESNVRGHLVGAKHKSRKMKMILEELVKQEQCLQTISSDSHEYECLCCMQRLIGANVRSHLTTVKHKRNTSDFEIIKSELDARWLRKESSGYLCLLCNAILTCSSTAKHHLAGARHKEAVSNLESETIKADVIEHFAGADHKEAASKLENKTIDNKPDEHDKVSKVTDMCLAWNNVGVCQRKQWSHVHKCNKCGGEHPRLECPTKSIKSCTEKGIPEKVPRLTGMCNYWNVKGICPHTPCSYIHRCNFCGGEHQRMNCTTKHIESENEKGLQEMAPTLAGMCNAWNKSGNCHHKQCWHLHRCNFCGGEHPRISCTTKSIKSGNEKGLQDKRPIKAGMCNAWNKSGICPHKQCWHLHRCNFCGGEHPRLKCPNEIVKTENGKGISDHEISYMPIPSGTNLSIPHPACGTLTPSPVSIIEHSHSHMSPVPHPTQVSSLTIPPQSPIQSPYIPNPVIPPLSVSSLTIPPPSHIQSTYNPNPVPPPVPISPLTIPPPSHIQSSYTPNPVPPLAPISSLTIPPPSHIQSSYTPNPVPPPVPISSLTIPPPSHIQSSYTPSSVPPPAPVSSIITASASTVSTSLPHFAPLPPRLQNLTDSHRMTTAPSINQSDLGFSFATKQNHVAENSNIKLNNENLAEGIRCDRSPKRSYKFSTNRSPDERDNSERKNKRHSSSRRSEKLDKEYIKSPVRRHRHSESKSPERKQRKYKISPDRCYKKLDRNHDRKRKKKLRSKSPDQHDGSSKNVQINKACKSLMIVCDKIGILGHSLRAALDKTQKYRNDCSKIIETLSDPDGQELLLLIETRLNKLCEETKDNMLQSLFRDASLATSLLLKTTKSYLGSPNSDTESKQSSKSYSFNESCTNTDIQNKCSYDLTLEEKKLIQRISEGKLNDIRF